MLLFVLSCGLAVGGSCRTPALLAGLVCNPPHRLFASGTTSRMSTIAFIGFPKTCFCTSSVKRWTHRRKQL